MNKQILKSLVITFLTVSIFGCSSVSKSLAKTDNSAKPSEIKPALPARSAPTSETKLFNVNLIQNSGAEDTDSHAWTPADDLKNILYGDYGGGPDRNSPGPANRGERYFYARTTRETPSVTFTQTVDIKDIAEAVDKSGVNYAFGGWFGRANGSSSIGGLNISFLDKDGKELLADATDEIKESESPADQVLVERNKTGSLPAGTRKIVVNLEFHIFVARRSEEVDNLAFADNLSLILTTKGAN